MSVCGPSVWTGALEGAFATRIESGAIKTDKSPQELARLYYHRAWHIAASAVRAQPEIAWERLHWVAGVGGFEPANVILRAPFGKLLRVASKSCSQRPKQPTKPYFLAQSTGFPLQTERDCWGLVERTRRSWDLPRRL